MHILTTIRLGVNFKLLNLLLNGLKNIIVTNCNKSGIFAKFNFFEVRALLHFGSNWPKNSHAVFLDQYAPPKFWTALHEKIFIFRGQMKHPRERVIHFLLCFMGGSISKTCFCQKFIRFFMCWPILLKFGAFTYN